MNTGIKILDTKWDEDGVIKAIHLRIPGGPGRKPFEVRFPYIDVYSLEYESAIIKVWEGILLGNPRYIAPPGTQWSGLKIEPYWREVMGAVVDRATALKRIRQGYERQLPRSEIEQEARRLRATNAKILRWIHPNFDPYSRSWTSPWKEWLEGRDTYLSLSEES